MGIVSDKVYCVIMFMGGLIDEVAVACSEPAAKEEIRAMLSCLDNYGTDPEEDYVACYLFDLPNSDAVATGKWIGNWDATSACENVDQRFEDAVGVASNEQ